jgi:uncharacterized repeat protein (TIGR01451 family)
LKSNIGTAQSGVDLTEKEQGYGPARQLFTMVHRPDQSVFNSIMDNPDNQNEEEFLQIRELGAASGVREGDVLLQPRKTYEETIYFHNDVSPDSGSQISRNTRVIAQLPATVASRERASAIVTSGTTEIPAVWRSLVLATPLDTAVALRIVPNSAWMYTAQLPGGSPLSLTDLFSQQGTLVGCDKADGIVTGADSCSGSVRFQFVTDQPDFSISQRVSVSGGNQWGNAPELPAGQTIDYKIEYKNMGTMQQNNVVIKEALGKGVTYVSGSMQLATSATQGHWAPTHVDSIVARGINIGSYASNGNAYIKFTARLPTDDRLACGSTSVIATATVETDNGAKSAASTVWMTRTC